MGKRQIADEYAGEPVDENDLLEYIHDELDEVLVGQFEPLKDQMTQAHSSFIGFDRE